MGRLVLAWSHPSYGHGRFDGWSGGIGPNGLVGSTWVWCYGLLFEFLDGSDTGLGPLLHLYTLDNHCQHYSMYFWIKYYVL